MKIVEVHIYGYGKIENLVIKDVNQLQVFYGANEAGKSTIMSFIHSILFGFPTKLQSDLRYEPKNHTKYGGKLIVNHPSEGIVVIERVKGKAIGDVLVKLEKNGTLGGEELLSGLLKNIDKAMFQSIYSFNLNGLQNIHQIKSEDLGKFLFSTGAVGTDKLLKVEMELKKELENRFKPGGKKPVLNEKLKDLHDLDLKVKEAAKKNEAYSSYLQKRLSLEESIDNLQTELKDLHYKNNRLNEWKNHFPYVQELKSINKELSETNLLSFPIDGMKRFESIGQLLKPLEAQLSGLEDKRERMKEKVEQIKVNHALLNQELEVETAIANLPLFDQLTKESFEMKYQMESIHVKITELKEKLYYPIDEEKLPIIDTSIFMKEKIGQAQAKLFRLRDQKQMLDHRFHEEKNTLEQLEQEITFLESQLLTEQERNLIIQQMKQKSVQEQTKKELKEVQDRIEFHHFTKETKNYDAIKSKRQTSFVLLFFIFLGIWSGFNKEWLLLSATFIFFILFGLFYLKKADQNPNSTTQLTDLFEKEKQLLAEISTFLEIELDSLQLKLEADNKYREQIQASKGRCSQQQLRYDQVIEAYEKWEKDSKVHSDEMVEIIHLLQLPNHIPFERLSDAFQIISDMQDLIVEKKKLLELRIQIAARQNDIQNDINGLGEQFLIEKKASIVETCSALKELLREAQQNISEQKSFLQKIEELEVDYATGSKEQQYLSEELSLLLKEVSAINEDEFRLKAIEAKKRIEQLDRVMAIQRQIEMAGFSIKEYEEFKDHIQLQDQIERWNLLSSELEESMKQQQNELADIKYQITLLEEGGTYSELLHRYKQMKFEFDEQARIWGSYSIAKHLLTKTIERYKNEKLPQLLNRAEEYFSYLTMGSYIRIHAKNEGAGFLIERSDHTFFEANELSQATMEQVYVSLRLALATTLYDKLKLPIIIDDSFVNFDHQRTKRMLDLLIKIKDHQILFFTCHSHLLTYFEEQQILPLEKSEELIGQ